MSSMEISDQVIVEIAISEILNPVWGVTSQFLEVHEVVMEEGVPKVVRVDRESPNGTAIVYFQVKDEKFFLAVAVQTEPELIVGPVFTENGNMVYLAATSDELSFAEMKSLTKLVPTKGWS